MSKRYLPAWPCNQIHGHVARFRCQHFGRVGQRDKVLQLRLLGQYEHRRQSKNDQQQTAPGNRRPQPYFFAGRCHHFRRRRFAGRQRCC